MCFCLLGCDEKYGLHFALSNNCQMFLFQIWEKQLRAHASGALRLRWWGGVSLGLQRFLTLIKVFPSPTLRTLPRLLHLNRLNLMMWLRAVVHVLRLHAVKAEKRALHAWDAVKDDMLKVSFECSAPVTTQCVVCLEHADCRCTECSTTAVFCEACLRRTCRNSLHLPDKVECKNSSMRSIHTDSKLAVISTDTFESSNCFSTM